MKDDTRHPNDNRDNYAPPRKKADFVMHNGKTRYAYKGADGKWRDFYTDEVLEGEVSLNLT